MFYNNVYDRFMVHGSWFMVHGSWFMVHLLNTLTTKMSNESRGDMSRKQFYGLKSEVMIQVPERVRRAAMTAYELRSIGFRGGMETGWKRAHQLSTEREISIEDLRYMRAWFARHLYASFPTYKEWTDSGKPMSEEWWDKRGILSWLIWGGTPAFKWVFSKANIKLLNDYFDANYTALRL